MNESIDFEHDGSPWTLTIGFFNDGRFGEVFLVPVQKSGSETERRRTHADISVMASHLLQNGYSVNALSHSMLKLTDGTPASVWGRVMAELSRG